MNGKVILVTGGNSGIGLHAAGQLAKKGATVIITTRDEAKAAAARDEIFQTYGQKIDTVTLELADLASVRRCADEILQRYSRLDVLVNNAGLSVSDRRETAQGFEYVLGVNHVGPFVLTSFLIDRLLASAPARVVCLSSAAHFGARRGIDWDDLQRHHTFGMQPYCQVKLGTILWVKELARRYGSKGLTAYAVNPRFVATHFAQDGDTSGLQKWFFRLGKLWMLTPAEGAKTVVWCASEPGIESLTGQYFENCAPKKPSPFAQDAASAERWWALSDAWARDGHP